MPAPMQVPMRALALASAFAAACATAAAPLALRAQHRGAPTFEVRAITHQARVRSALGTIVPPERAVPMYGFELVLPTGWRPLAIEGRFLRSAHGRADLRSRDLGLTLGSEVFRLAAAYGDRGSYEPASGLAHHRDAAFIRVGVRIGWRPSGSGLLLRLHADHYLPLRAGDVPPPGLRGTEVATAITYRPLRLPMTASIGYRLERFRIFRVDQEVSALTLALGYAVGGRRDARR